MIKRDILKHYPFMLSQVTFFTIVILICTTIMSVYSYGLLNKQITKRTIESNSVLLNQYSNTVDTFVLNVVDETLREILLNVRTNNELNYYLYNPVEGHAIGMLKIKEYLEKLKFFNPLVFSVAIYYKKNNLIVSTDNIRYCFDKNNKTIHMNIVNNAIQYYNNLLDSISADNTEKYGFVFDNGINMHNNLNNDRINVPENVIHFVRTITGLKELYGAIIVTINGDVLKDMLKNYAPDNLENIVIIDENGVILTHTNKQYIGENISNLEYGVEAFASNKKTGYYISDINNNPVVISFQRSSHNNWKYIAVTPMLSFKTTTKLIINIIASAALLSLVIGFAVSYIVAKYMSKPIKDITEQCTTISYKVHR